MITREVEYVRPTTVEEAVSIMTRRKKEALFLAGGTDLVLAMKRGTAGPGILVDVASLRELAVLELENGYLRIGAGLSFSLISTSELVRRWAPALAYAAAEIGSPQIRARGTLGGNIATCSPAGDCLPALMVHDAFVVVEDHEGEHIRPFEAFVATKAEKKHGDELIREIRIPVHSEEQVDGAFVKLGRRNALAIARMSCAMTVRRKEDGRPFALSLVLGAVAPVPLRLALDQPGETSLDERSAEAAAELAAQAVAESIPGRPSARYKSRAVKGVVLEAFERVRNGRPG
jgi:carbon-monoxide dehydrogenase medium subunit